MMLIARNVAFYLVIGAVIAGLIDLDPEDGSFYLALLMWPLVLILIVLIFVAMVAKAIVKAIKKGIHG